MKAYVFPGQGAQFPGMGKDLYKASLDAKQMFEEANAILGFSITDIMFGEDAEELKKTKVTQPAIFLHSVILAKVLGDSFNPEMAAGHSLGEFSALVSKIYKKKILKIFFLKLIFKAMSLIYLFLFSAFIFKAVTQIDQNFKIHMIYLFLICICSDVGGYIFGKTFKGKKLTKISPNKTISGSIGSFVFSLLLIPLFYDELTKYHFIILVLITIMISLTSQLGDLFISYLKRKAKIKNTSDILPGHGGFLDRVDGIIFAIPVGILLFNLF